MEDKSPQEKAWETMRSKGSGRKAIYTKRRKEGAKKAAAKIKNKQWDPEKVEYLRGLKEKAIPNMCAICGDSRSFVLQNHHLDLEKKIEITLCANCHDTVRRGTLEDLIKAHKRNGNESI